MSQKPGPSRSPTSASSASSSSSHAASHPPPVSAAAPVSTALARLNRVAAHLSPAMAASIFSADIVPQAPEDPLFGLARAYKADKSPLKVDLVRLPLSR